jgi:hypothetical protein
VTLGCFFAGQSINYRAIFLLMVLPALLALREVPMQGAARVVVGLSAPAIVVIMWGECFRRLAIPVLYELQCAVWLVREIAWWGVIGILAACVADFLARSAAFKDLRDTFSWLAGGEKAIQTVNRP